MASIPRALLAALCLLILICVAPATARSVLWKPSCKGAHKDHPFGQKCAKGYYICAPPYYKTPKFQRCPPGTVWNGIAGWSDGACEWKDAIGCK